MRIRDTIHTDRFPPSYYAATSSDSEPFLRLEGNMKVDVCVVGGGFTGVATALHLAEKGYDVALVEQNKIGWGASGRNGGQVIGGYGPPLSNIAKIKKIFGNGHAQAAWQMGVECVDIIRNWVAKYSIDCDLKWGYFDAAVKNREMDELKKSMEVLVGLGYWPEQKLLGRDQIGGIVGSDRFIGGLVNMGWGHCHTLNLVRGEARAAERLGARIFEDARVSSLGFADDHVTVDMDTCRVTANIVVLAGNAYLGKLVPKLASRVLPAGSYIIATESLGERLASEILPTDYAVRDQRQTHDYFRLSADKRLLFGGLTAYSGRHPRDIAAIVRSRMLKVFHQLEDVRVDYSWGGYMGIGLNRIPQVGRLKSNVYFAQGYSGHGVAQAHMSARLIAEAIAGQFERFDILAKIKHSPFPGGQFFAQPLQAIGMTYYRMKEALG